MIPACAKKNKRIYDFSTKAPSHYIDSLSLPSVTRLKFISAPNEKELCLLTWEINSAPKIATEYNLLGFNVFKGTSWGIIPFTPELFISAIDGSKDALFSATIGKLSNSRIIGVQPVFKTESGALVFGIMTIQKMKKNL